MAGGIGKLIKGRPMTKVKKFPKIMAWAGDLLFSRLRSMAWMPKKKPLMVASILPQKPSKDKLSKKNMTIPKNMSPTKNQSRPEVLSLNIKGAKTATQSGAVYCRTITLAAGAMVMAMTKRIDNMDRKDPAKM
jgi:hypothetical protein